MSDAVYAMECSEGDFITTPHDTEDLAMQEFAQHTANTGHTEGDMKIFA